MAPQTNESEHDEYIRLHVTRKEEMMSSPPFPLHLK